MKIILISGKQGSGKSTIADAIKTRAKALKYDFISMNKFAGTIYALHEYLLNRMEVLTGKPRIEKDGPLLQLLGTEWGRKTYGENVWVDILKKELSYYSPKLKVLVIIDDCRFENEFDAFPEALRVRLECSSAERKSRCPAWRDKEDHPSETGLDVYAEAGRFDLKIHTGCNSNVLENVERATSLIFSELQRESWIESRDPILHNTN